jgi:glycosyltransferase domain-containing protein
MEDIGKLLTLVIPVRERICHLPKIVRYYKDLECRKIIYDSSRNPYQGDTKGFDYMHVGPRYQHVAFFEAYDKVETPFLVNCPDDDLMMKSSIVKCVKFLKDNPTYSACDGEYINFDPHTKGLTSHGPNVFIGRAAYEWGDESFDERMDFLIVRCSRSPLHAVVRTSDARAIYKNFLENKIISPLGFQDRVYSFITACRGRVKTLQVPWHIRMSNNTPSADQIMHWQNIKNEVIDGYSLDLHINMQKCIDDKHCSAFSNYLAEAKDINISAALEATKEIFNKHYQYRQKYIPMYGRGFLLPQDRPKGALELPHRMREFGEELKEIITIMGDKL